MESRKDYDSVASALAVARKAIPRVYEITGLPEEFSFIVFGCQGHGDDTQRQTAAMMANKGTELAFGLGDNFYDFGIDSCISPLVHELFHGIYPPNIKFIMALGNHDRRQLNLAKALYSQYILWQPQGDDPSYNQIAITYHSSDETEHKRVVALFEKEKISFKDLMPWNMPAGNSSWIIHHTQIFMLDSSALLGAYLEYLKRAKNPIDGKEEDLANPVIWLMREFRAAKEKKRQTFIMMHHPLFNIGKRDFSDEFDTEHYINAAGIRQLCRLLHELNPEFTPTDSLGELLQAVFKGMDIEPDCFFNAHEHLLQYCHSNNIRQFTSGGGSGDLHSRVSMRRHPDVGFNDKDSGFVVVTCNAKNTASFKLDVHTLQGLHLRFNEASQFAIVEDHPDARVMLLRQAVLTACNQFFEAERNKEILLRQEYPPIFSKEEPLLGWLQDAGKYVVSSVRGKAHHVTRDKQVEKLIRDIQHIHTYFNQHHMPDLVTCLQALHEFMQPLLNIHQKIDNTDSFCTWLVNQVKTQMNVVLDELFAEHAVGIVTEPPSLRM